MGDKKFDIVVYGATGYTGKLVVDYMVSNYGKAENLKWAIACLLYTSDAADDP